MAVEELPVVFECGSDRLVGIATRPAAARALGVLILVGGRQYRAGSHRQFVLLARRLASADFCSFRCDFRGMGDSSGERRDFEDVGEDIAAALAAFRRSCPTLQRVVLWGLCDAATAAVLYWLKRRDESIGGLCLVNPWMRSESGLARARVRHYYKDRLVDPQFWKKLLGGRMNVAHALREYFRQRRTARCESAGPGFQDSVTTGLQTFPRPLLLLLSGRDLTAKEFLDTLEHAGAAGLLQRPNLRRVDVDQADHTFSRQAWRSAAEEATCTWLLEIERNDMGQNILAAP